MEIVAWVNLGVSAMLLVACIALYLDARGQRKVEDAALAALRRQTQANYAAIGTLSRTVGLLSPEARASTGGRRSGERPPRSSGRRGAERLDERDAEGLGRLDGEAAPESAPSAWSVDEQVGEADAGQAGAEADVEEESEEDGDRRVINPGDEVPGIVPGAHRPRPTWPLGVQGGGLVWRRGPGEDAVRPRSRDTVPWSVAGEGRVERVRFLQAGCDEHSETLVGGDPGCAEESGSCGSGEG